MHKIKITTITGLFTVLLLLPILLLTACQPQTSVKSPAENVTENISQATVQAAPVENISLESGFEITQGKMPQREATYDDIIDTPGANVAYRGNIQEVGKISQWLRVVYTQVILSSGFQVSYRDNIETQAGQIRTNVFHTILPGGKMTDYMVTLKLANMFDDIQVMKIEQSTWLADALALMIEIPPQIKPGDYKLEFLIFINGKYYGNLPCTIHVIE